MRQPTSSPHTEVTASVTVLIVRSDRARPRSTAIGGIGRERKRSTIPLSMSPTSPSAVNAALKVTAWAKIPPIRKVRYPAPPRLPPKT